MEKKTANVMRFVLLAAIISVVLLSSVLITNVWGKYFSQTSGENGANIAAWVFDVKDETNSIDIVLKNTIQKPGDFYEYKFSVTNKNGATVSQVKQNYTITLTQQGSLPLTYTLTTEGKDPASKTATASGETWELESDELAASTEKTVNYVLKVEWKEEENDSKYAEGVASIKVVFHSEQIEE